MRSGFRACGWTCQVGVALLIAITLLPVGSASASVERAPVWSRAVGGSPEAVAVDPGSGVYVTGWNRTPSGDNVMVVAKFGPLGKRLWRWTWRVQARDHWASGQAVAPVPGGGVYAGGSSGYGESGKAVVVRLSASGELVWRRFLPTNLGGNVTGLASDGHGVVAAVESEGCCAIFDHDGSLTALSPDGHVRWRTDLEAPGISGTWDRVGAVAIGQGGRIYAAGSVDRSVMHEGGPMPDEDVFVQQLTRDGKERWTKVLEGRPVRDAARATGIAVREGTVTVTGAVGVTQGREWHAWLGVFGTDGRTRWTDRWGDGRVSRSAEAVAIAAWGPIYVGALRSSWRTTSTLRRYTHGGTLVGERVVGVERGGYLTDVATADHLYLTIARRLERWPR